MLLVVYLCDAFFIVMLSVYAESGVPLVSSLVLEGFQYVTMLLLPQMETP
jgi:hypothetical protein